MAATPPPQHEPRVAELLERLDHEQRWQALALAMWANGWRAAMSHVASQLTRELFPLPPSPIDELRWGPGGRAHYGDPRPSDYQGSNGRCGHG